MSAEDMHITPEIILTAYSVGIFPMSEGADDPALFWVEPKKRGIIPLDSFRVAKRLARTVRSDRFSIVSDKDFHGVIDRCALSRPGSNDTWINTPIKQLYGELFRMGYCHTIEVYKDDQLVGGLYGIALGGAFFGESMFHSERDASKVALVHLVARLKMAGFALLDTQFLTEHLAQFGGIEISRRTYLKFLKAALQKTASWHLHMSETEINGCAAMNILSHPTLPAGHSS